MLNLIRQVLAVLNHNQKKKLYFLQVLVMLSAILELLSILSIAPFMAVAAKPALIQQNILLSRIQEFFEIYNSFNFLILFAIFVLCLLILSAAASIYTIWTLSLFAANVGAEFGDRLYTEYMRKDYLFHVSINTADLIRKIATEVNRVTDNVLQPMVQMNARIITISLIAIFLFIYEPVISVVCIFVLSFAYFILFILVRGRLGVNGQLISEYSKKRYVLMNEGFSAIKEIHILGRTNFFINSFKKSGEVFSTAYGTSNGLYNMPKYVLELFVYGSLMGFIIYLLNKNDNDAALILPVISMLGIAAMKLLPSFQQIYSGAAQIKNNISAFQIIRADLLTTINQNVDYSKISATTNRIIGDIELHNASFTYPGKIRPSLNKVTLKIKKNTSIGIVGPSGSGKSTLLDIMIGSIALSEGSFLIGGVEINRDNLAGWRNNIGYVPQTSLLRDGTIAENIAFGLSKNEIEDGKIEVAGRRAFLEDWINELPDGYNTRVGERGVQISGGQRQRIAIARALYNNANYFFFDEATSSLDGESEQNIMQSIVSMSGDKTMVLVAHRLNTVMHCDYIYLMLDGEIVDEGSYDHLASYSDHFKKLIGDANG
jgi:ABC-type multidrug transport system fused ATPase/permease subunit